MRVLSIGNFLNPSWDGSIPDEEHIAQALEQLGHEVTRCQRGEIPKYEAESYDFVLVAQWDGYDEGFSQGIKSEGCPIVYWAFDYQADGQEWHEKLIQESDLYLSKRIENKYPNWQWLSQDFAPQFLNRYPGDVKQDIDVLFTGSYLPWATERIETLKAVDQRFNLVVHSVTPDEWKTQGLKNVYGPVMDDRLPSLIARAKINLSIDHTIERGYWSDRNAQIIACGGFVLTRWVPMMESIFRSNVVYFHDKEHCLDQIEFWLEHDEDREVVAAEAYDNSPYFKVKERVADMLNIVRSIL